MSYHPLYSYRRNLGSYVTEPSARETLSTTNALLHSQQREESFITMEFLTRLESDGPSECRSLEVSDESKRCSLSPDGISLF